MAGCVAFGGATGAGADRFGGIAAVALFGFAAALTASRGWATGADVGSSRGDASAVFFDASAFSPGVARLSGFASATPASGGVSAGVIT